MILFFQRPSWLLAALAWRRVRSCDTAIFFQSRDLSRNDYPDLPGAGLRRLIRFLNPCIRFERLPEELYLRLWLDNNAASDQEMDRVFEKARRCSTFRRLAERVGEKGLDRYYKIRLLPWVLSETLYYRIAHHLRKERAVSLIPSGADPFRFHAPFLAPGEWAAAVPAPVQGWLRAKESLGRMCRTLSAANLFRVSLYCLQPLVRLLAAGRVALRAPESMTADWVAPIVSGFAGNSFKGAGHGDDFLLDSRLTPDRVLFYFSSWKFSPEEKRRQATFMEGAGIRWVDPDRFQADPAYGAEALGFCADLLSGMMRLSALAEEPRFTRTAGAFARQYLQELLFARRVRFKVSVEFQDYSCGHVVRTMVANRFGRKTIGIHHGAPAASWVFPTLRYTHVDRHCVWGPAFLRMHQDHWGEMDIVPVGAYRIDSILEAAASPIREKLQGRYQETYGGRRPLILLLLPSLHWYILRSRMAELMQGLRQLGGLSQPYQVVCRYRSPQQRDRWHQAGLSEILRSELRIREDISELTTAEWMSLSDAVISSAHSTGMIEAAGAGIPCGTFDYMLTGDLAYGRYGPNLVLKNADDLLHFVQTVQLGNCSGIRKGGARLAEDFSYYLDGKNTDRFRSAIAGAVR